MRFPFLAIAVALVAFFRFRGAVGAANRQNSPSIGYGPRPITSRRRRRPRRAAISPLSRGGMGGFTSARRNMATTRSSSNSIRQPRDREHGKNAMRIVVDAEKEIGVDRKGFAAQAKFHTRGNVGESGRIYHGTKQGYPKEGEKRSDYLGGHPIVYDPATGKSRVYDIPIPHQGVISVAPDESRGVAYISTCSDERPIESTHFMILDLATGKYRDLLDCRHMYAFIVVDHLGRAYHPIVGGEIARYDPRTDKLARLKQTIDGQPPSEESLLAHPESHPINWEISPDRKTLYAVAMSGNQLYCYDLTGEGDTLAGRSLGALVPDAKATDCRALCVAHDGTVWAGVATSYEKRPSVLRLVSFRPGDAALSDSAPTDRGPIAIGNPDYTTFTDAAGKTKPHHNGVERLDDGTPDPAVLDHGDLRRPRRHGVRDDALAVHAARDPISKGGGNHDRISPQFARGPAPFADARIGHARRQRRATGDVARITRDRPGSAVRYEPRALQAARISDF